MQKLHKRDLILVNLDSAEIFFTNDSIFKLNFIVQYEPNLTSVCSYESLSLSDFKTTTYMRT